MHKHSLRLLGSVVVLTTLAGPALAQSADEARDKRELRNDAREVRRDNAEIRNDLFSVAKLESLLGRFDTARVDRDPQALVTVQAELRQLVGYEIRREKADLGHEKREAM